MPGQSGEPAAPRVSRAAPARSQPQPGADSLNVLQTADVLAEGARPLEMLLDPLLPAGSVLLAHGPAGVGLSHFLIGCAAALASGGTCTDAQAPRPVRVVFVAGSLPTTIVSQRFARALASREAEAGDRLTVVSVDEQEKGAPDLARKPDVSILWQTIGDAEVLVIDDLPALLPSFYRAAGEQAASLTQMLFAFRQRGLTIIAGVHTGRKHEAGRVDRAAFSSVDRVADIVVGLRRPKAPVDDRSVWCEMEIERAAHLPERLRMARHRRLVIHPETALPVAQVRGAYRRRVAFFDLMSRGWAAPAAAMEIGASRAQAYRWRRCWLLDQGARFDENMRLAPLAEIVRPIAAGEVLEVATGSGSSWTGTESHALMRLESRARQR